jgi:uncharacterized protein YoaH (UPF0181 family)
VKNQQAVEAERQDNLDSGLSAGQAVKAGRQEFRHEVLEDCMLNGVYRAKGEIVFSEEKKVPHCSVIE